MSRVFVAAGLDGFTAVSKDGRKWDSNEGREGDSHAYITFNKGKCLVVGRRGGEAILSCTDNGKKWHQEQYPAKYSEYARTAFAHQGKFKVIVGGDSTNGNSKASIIESEDGMKWSGAKSIGGGRVIRRVAVNGDQVVAVGDYGRKAVSNDALQWQDAKEIKAVETLIDITYGNGVFVGGGLHGMRMSSKDGLDWSKKVEGEEGEHINSIFFDGKQFVGVGLGGTYFSPNGRSWRRVINNEAPHIVAYGNGVYVGAKWKGRIFLSRDAVKWEEVANLKGSITTIGFGEMG